MAQIPEGAEGTAAGVLIYSSICLLSSCLVIWLVWTHHDQTNYVSFLAYFTTASTLSSIIQQTRAVLYWRDQMTERFEYARSNPGNPELLISNGAVGVDLVLFYIQFYSYNVQALFVMFWAFQLAQLVYGLHEKQRLKQPLKIVNLSGKAFSIAFPLVTTCSLQSRTIRQDLGGFLLLAGQPLFWSIGFGTIAVLSILVRYIQSRRKLQKLQSSYGQPSCSSTSTPRIPQQEIYDRWLLTRFTIAFIILTVFEIAIVLFSFNAKNNIEADVRGDSPDLSAERAKSDFRLFMPGVTASLLLFLVFGTTLPFLKYMRRCLSRQDNVDDDVFPDTSPLRSLPSRHGDTDECGISRPLGCHQSVRQSRIIELPGKRPDVWVYKGTPPPRMMDEQTVQASEKSWFAGKR